MSQWSVYCQQRKEKTTTAETTARSQTESKNERTQGSYGRKKSAFFLARQGRIAKDTYELNRLDSFPQLEREVSFWNHSRELSGSSSNSSSNVPSLQKTHRRGTCDDTSVLTNYHFAINRNAKVYSGQSPSNISVDWASVEAVVLFNDDIQENITCPICLDQARAPRMTKCGHLFCYICVLKFFSHHDMSSCNCPLCGKRIRLEDIRAADIRLVPPLVVGAQQEMRLVVRKKDSFIIEPFYRNSWRSFLTSSSIPADEKDSNDCEHMRPIYSRVFVANEERLLHLLKKDQKDMEDALEEDSSNLPFVDFAMEDITQRKTHLERVIRQQRRELFFEISSTDKASKNDPEYSSQDVDVSSFEYHRFLFQAESGQDVYLHPINVKCLLSYYEHLCFAPHLISGRVVELEHLNMTEELRKRFRFLSHLPVGCEFCFIELDLSEVLPAEILAKFSKVLKQRMKDRKQREEEALAFHREKDSIPAYAEERQRLFSNPDSFQPVDMDENSFPSLVKVDVVESQCGCPEDSTYASVTSHMGYFPSIFESINPLSPLFVKTTNVATSPTSSQRYLQCARNDTPKDCSSHKKREKKNRIVLSNIPRRGCDSYE
eukprot:jgi/Galph1/4898/GphlegSOOS_G3592.1